MTAQSAAGAPDLEPARVLGSPSRLLVLEVLQAAEAPLGVEEIALEVGLRASAVRAHLDVLQSAGLVRRTIVRNGRRGRPQFRFSPSRFVEAPVTVADLGYAVARSVADWPALVRRHADDLRGALAELLERQGFAPIAGPGASTVSLHRCPYATSLLHERSICEFHDGVIRGALEATCGASVTAALEPFSSPGVCTLRLEHTPAGMADAVSGSRRLPPGDPTTRGRA